MASQNQVQGFILWKLLVEPPQELQKFLVPMAGIAFADDATLCHLQRRNTDSGSQSGYPFGCFVCQDQAVATMSSSFGYFGFQPG